MKNKLFSAAPEWISEPQNTEKSTNEKATFECRARGSPEPAYQWFINGVPFEDGMLEKQ